MSTQKRRMSLKKEEQEKLLGLLKTPARNAQVYYRDTSDWGEEMKKEFV